MIAQKPFQMKKRSFKPLWIFWLFFFTFITSVGGTLTVSELFILSNQRVVYTSIRGTNIEDRRAFPIADESFINGVGPVFFFGKDEIIIGSSKSVTAPSPSADVLLIPKAGWQSHMIQKIMSNENLRKLFPTDTFGVFYSTKYADVFSYSDLSILTDQVRLLNLEADPLYPKLAVPYLLNLRSGFVGVN